MSLGEVGAQHYSENGYLIVPADQVRFVPAESTIVEAVEKAGFGYVEIQRLSVLTPSDSACRPGE